MLARLVGKLGALGLLGALLLGGCSGKVTEEDLQKWTHNEVGLQRISKLVANADRPMKTRVRALEVVIEKGFPTEVRSMVADVPAKAGRDELVKRLSKRLVDTVGNREKAQVEAKDALLALSRYMSEESVESTHEAIAAWAFRDISWDTAEKKIKTKTEQRISSGQITELGRHGWKGGAILLSHGFAVESMLQFLTTAKDPKAAEYLLKGIRRLHRRRGVGMHHLDRLSNTESPRIAAYLLDLYMDGWQATCGGLPESEKKTCVEEASGKDDLGSDIRTGAFNAAISIIEKEGTKEREHVDAAVEELLALMERENVEDRWLGAINAVNLAGPDRLDAILERFADDGIYTRTDGSPVKKVQDFCLDIRDRDDSEGATPVFEEHLDVDNDVVEAISVACLKTLQAYDLRERMAEIAREERDTSLEDFLGEGFTLGRLALNAHKGLDLMKKVEKAHEEGELDETQARHKKFIITVELAAVGDRYEKLVSKRFEAFKKKYEKNPEKFEK